MTNEIEIDRVKGWWLVVLIATIGLVTYGAYQMYLVFPQQSIEFLQAFMTVIAILGLLIAVLIFNSVEYLIEMRRDRHELKQKRVIIINQPGLMKEQNI